MKSIAYENFGALVALILSVWGTYGGHFTQNFPYLGYPVGCYLVILTCFRIDGSLKV